MPSVVFLYARVLFLLLLVGRRTRHRATRYLEALVPTCQSRAVLFERLSVGYYCSTAAKKRLACTKLLSGPGLPTERVHARPDLKLPATVQLLQGIALPALNCWLAVGFQPNGCIRDLSLNCPATVLLLQILVLLALNCCLALDFKPTGLMPDLS